MKSYCRNLLTTFPPALWQCWKELGWKGAYLAVCVFVLRRVPFPLRVTPLLEIVNWHEAANFVDNFVQGELRQPEVENMLRGEAGEVIEVGVNVGVTTRWWLGSGPGVRVVGIDMMDEALNYTRERLQQLNLQDRGTFVLGAVGSSAGETEVAFDDPLEGTNSVRASQGASRRMVEVNTLDAYLDRADVSNPRLLKIDIEGAAGEGLRGAERILRKVPWVVVETHDDDELTSCAEQLTRRGFALRHFHGRTMWWHRAGEAQTA